jgi:RNA 2',3'-cyclic 3'-phosphodiesterase
VSGDAARESAKLRLFFALWPGDARRAALAAAASAALAGVEAQRVPPGNLHVTLAFLGAVPGAQLARLVEAGGAAGPWPDVALTFERVEYWARPRVVVALPASVPAAGRDLVDRLWRSLEPLGFERELRPWQPHLTLARKVRRRPAGELPWPAVESAGDEPAWRLALVESSSHREGVRYKPLADWPLTTWSA